MKMFLVVLLWPGLALAQYTKPLVQADISHMADTAHVEFRGLKNWRYDLQRSEGKKLVLTVAPVDDASLTRLRGFSDAYIDSVTVDKNGVDGDHVVTFHLAHGDIEHFDYLTDEPSRLIVDFYKKPAEKAAPAAAAPGALPATASPAAKNTAAKAKTKSKNKEGYADTPKPSRTPAGDEFITGTTAAAEKTNVDLHFGVFDGSDDNYDRFRIKDYEIREDAAISSRNNIYLPFPVLKMQVSILERLLEQTPEYVINPKDTAENKEARLLLTLFNRKRFGHFQKTFDYFTGKYPGSEYNEILKNLAANVYLHKWQQEKKQSDFEKARAIFNELVQKYPGSPLREYNYMILGFAQMEHGEALATLQTFEGFIKEYPKSPEMPHVRKALAESYMILRKYDEATAELETIMKDFARTEHAQEARYRLGDVQFAKGELTQAIRAYEAAIKDLPAQEKVYPNASFNMAEARFWQKDFKKSLGNYVQFVNLFPTHEHGGYALTRIGELLGILGADQRRVMGAFLESYFRFPEHPGAKVARIRMLSQQMRGMKETELKKALQEIKDAATKVALPGMEEFTTLMAAEGLTNRGQNRDALSSLITYYQKNPSSVNLGSFKQRILRNIANELKTNVENGEFMRALSFNSKYSGTWLKNSDRIDVPYIVGGAFENAGAYNEAEKIYRSALAQRKAIVGTDIEKEKKVQEHLPSVSSLNLRLAAVLSQERNYIEAYQHLKAIGGTELTPEENIERVRLSALIAEQRNDLPKAREALLELSKRWQGDPALLAPVHLQLAQTYLKLNDPKQSEYYADKALAGESGEAKVDERVVAGAFQVKGDAMIAQKKAMAAVESYQKLLERFEEKMPLASIRYKVGQILFDHGDLQGASDVWKRLEGTPNEFLWKIGKAKLEDSQWKGEYNKYINRIPAMTSNRQKEKP
jgi:tetratricopeptide (TPR) repeat protein